MPSIFGSFLSNGFQRLKAASSLINGKIASGDAAIRVERWMRQVSGRNAAMIAIPDRAVSAKMPMTLSMGHLLRLGAHVAEPLGALAEVLELKERAHFDLADAAVDRRIGI